MPTTPTVATIDIDDSLEALLDHRSASLGNVYVVTLFVLLAGLVAVILIPLDVDVRAPATMRPVSERQTLRALTDGIIERVATRRGATVHRGDTIAVLRSIEGNRALATARMAEREQRAFARDLRALLGGTPERGDDAPVAMAELLELPRSRAALAEADAEWRQLSAEVRRAKQVVERLRELAHRGFAASAELEPAELELTRAQESRALALRRRRSQWSSQLAESEHRSRELERALVAALTDRSNRAIIAPIGGTVEELAPLTPASTVRAGDPIATISPDTTLVGEALVSPRDAGWVRPGMRARLLVDGYDVQQWGAATGVVTSIGRDYTVVGDRPVFAVQIRLDHAELRRPDGEAVPLSKGLRAQVRFLVARRTVGQMLMRRGREWVDASTVDPTEAR